MIKGPKCLLASLWRKRTSDLPTECRDVVISIIDTCTWGFWFKSWCSDSCFCLIYSRRYHSVPENRTCSLHQSFHDI